MASGGVSQRKRSKCTVVGAASKGRVSVDVNRRDLSLTGYRNASATESASALLFRPSSLREINSSVPRPKCFNSDAATPSQVRNEDAIRSVRFNFHY